MPRKIEASVLEGRADTKEVTRGPFSLPPFFEKLGTQQTG
jgi:hypothetical protein